MSHDPDHYDEIPYDSKPFRATHPDNLAAVATLHGLDPPAVETCRCLELGAGTGGNLLPMAAALPGASFVGVDLSRRQVEIGQELIAAAQLGNVELHELSITDVGEQFGRFDYIVAHGVYSWVPEPVREKILEIVRRLLAPSGVACISYNTYPGWHARRVVRDAALWHARQTVEPRARLARAREMAEFLATSMPDASTPFAQVIAGELEIMQAGGDTYVFHEHLEGENRPFYFYEFAARAAASGLQYVGEARFDDRLSQLAPATREAIVAYAEDAIEAEQYVDFLFRRTYRETVLAHVEAPVQRSAEAARCRRLHFSALARPATDVSDLRSDRAMEFVLAEGVTLTTNDPLAKAALALLAETSPATLAYAELRSRIAAAIGDAVELDARLCAILLRCVEAKAVMIHAAPLHCVARPDERPQATPLARVQAARGERVVTLHHLTADLTPLERALVTLLDGRRDRAALAEELARIVAAGDLQLHVEGRALVDSAEIKTVIAASVAPALERIARQALLVEQDPGGAKP